MVEQKIDQGKNKEKRNQPTGFRDDIILTPAEIREIPWQNEYLVKGNPLTCNIPIAKQKPFPLEDYETSYGKLIVQVLSAQGALPVRHATVTIYRKDRITDDVYLVAFLDTDPSGETPRLELPAPIIANSLSPDLPAFSTYFAEIYHAGYQTMKNLPLQIFPERTAVLSVNLIPSQTNVSF